MTTKPPEGYAKKSPLCRGCGAGLGEYHHLYDGFCSTCIETERDTLRVRLEAADKSDRHNEAVINELKRQLTEAVQERNTAHEVGFRKGVEMAAKAADEHTACYEGYKSGVLTNQAIAKKIRALLPQPGDQAKE